MPFRGRERDQLEDWLDRRREMREDVVGGFAEIEGRTYPIKNWSPNGFCIGPIDLAPNPGDRLDISFTIPLPDDTLTFQCRTGVMRHDPESQEIGGVFFNMSEEVQAVVEEHFDIRAPKGHGTALFAMLRAAVGVVPASGPARVNAKQGDLQKDAPFANGDPGAAATGELADGAEAVRDYRDAAEKGYADGQALLGLSHLMGEGVPQDYVQAQMWLNLAARQGHEEAVKGLEIVAKLMTLEQIADAQGRTREWLRQHQGTE